MPHGCIHTVFIKYSLCPLDLPAMKENTTRAGSTKTNFRCRKNKFMRTSQLRTINDVNAMHGYINVGAPSGAEIRNFTVSKHFLPFTLCKGVFHVYIFTMKFTYKQYLDIIINPRYR